MSAASESEPAVPNQDALIARVRAQAAEGFGAMRSVFANPSLRRLQLAYAGSAIGQWAASVAVTLYTFEIAGASGVALQIALRMVPAAVAAPYMSSLADRYPRARVMAVSDLTRIPIVAGMIALVALDAPLITILLGSALSGIAATAFDPARAAIVTELAERPEDVTAANVASSTTDSVSLFVGPALGGLLVSVTSVEATLAVTAGTFLWSAALLSGIPRTRPAGSDEESEVALGARLAAGIRVVAGSPPLRIVVGFMAAQTFVDGLIGVLLASVALELLDIGGGGLGALDAAVGIGALVGAGIAVALAGVRRLVPSFALGCVLWGVPLAVIGLVPELAVALVALAVLGLGNTLIDVSGYTLLQRAAPEEVIGRVFGVLEVAILMAIALGAAMAPALDSVLGTRGALVATGALLPVLVAARWRSLARIDASVADAVDPADIALLRGVPVFAPLGAMEIERMASRLGRLRVPAGQTIIEQGDVGDRWFLIADGACEVSVDGRPVRREEPGDTFGEIALLHDVPRTGTVRALTDCELRSLARDDFLTAVGANPSSAAAAEATASARLATARPAALGI